MKFNIIRILGIILLTSSGVIQYMAIENNYSFFLGVLSGIGIVLIIYGRLNIFKGVK